VITRGTGAVTFTSTVDSQASEANGLTINGASGGNVTFTGKVGSAVNGELGAILVSTGQAVTFGSTVEAASLVQAAGSGTTTLGGAVTTTGALGVSIVNAAISVSGPITTTTGNGSVMLTAEAGTLTIAAVGDIASGGTVDLTGSPGISTGGDVTSIGVQTWSGGVMLQNNVTFRATNTHGDIRFDGTINGAGGSKLTIDAKGNVAFGGSIGDTTSLASVAVDAGTDPGETIEFGAGVGTVSADAIALNTNRPAIAAAVATIVGHASTSFVTDDFAMGQGHKLTVLGDVTIGAAGGANAGSVTLGDVVALGDLRVNADSIIMLGRPAEMILTNTGTTVLDPAVDYIVDGQVFFSVTPTMGGAVPGNRAEFASASGAVDGSGTLTGFQQYIYAQPITTAVVTGPANAVLDLRASDTRSQQINPATVIPPGGAHIFGLGSAVPDDEESEGEADGAESGDTAAP
jgi:hypothetical protein